MGDLFPLFLPLWCPEGIPPPVDRVLIQEKVSRVKGVPTQKRTVLLVYRPLLCFYYAIIAS